MGKKLFSLCMALALCLSLLPVTALADAPNGQVIYVGNENVTSGGYWTTDSAGNVTQYNEEGKPSNNYIHYNTATNTLTLHNATIKESVSTDTSTYVAGAAIGVHNQNGVAELTITLEGTNTIEDVSAAIHVFASSTSTGAANLTITGNGSLNASGSYNPGIRVQSNTGNGTLAITGAKVTASSSSGGNGVQIRVGNGSNASLTVNGGSLTATGSGVSRGGIEFQFGSSESGPGTPSLNVSGSAIVKASGDTEGITSNSSPVTPSGTGIVFNNGTGTVYGNVTLEDDLEIASGETLTVPDGSSLNCNGKLTNNGTILASGGTVTGSLSDNTQVTTPTISVQPQNKEVQEGSAAEFSVTASGAQTYQWQQSTDNGGNWTNIESATDAGHTISSATTGMSGYQYRCVVTGSGGVSVISSAATLTVTALPEPEPEPEPTPPPYIPPTYAVTAPETTGGTVTVSPSRASSGRTVTITATPDLGYELERLTVRDSRDNEITLTDKGDGKYTFTMPASRVTVEASFAPAPLPFEDVAPGAWYEEAVRYAYFHNIMEGMRETEFSPTTALTRAMAAQILYNLEGQPDLSDENLGYPYEDVDAQAWYGNAVYWARITGVATGYGDGTFQPGDSITRQEFAQMLYNYAKYKGYDLTAEGDLAQFPDSESVADWAEAAMRWANGNELINGHDDGTIDAAGIGTRAQAASILMKFDQNLVEN